jgi:hypothetical protein
MLGGLEVLRLGSPGLSIAQTGGGAAPVEELFPSWTTGRVFQWSVDPSDFTVTNYDTITDGGQPALRHHTGGEFSEASVLTTATDIAAARIAVKYRAQPASGLGITNISIMPHVRYTDANNRWWIARDRGDGASWMLINEKSGGSSIGGSALGGDTAMDNTDTTTYWWLVMDVFWDVIRGKEWAASGSEPGWKGVTRFRPMSGWGGSTTDLDNSPESGSAGLRAMYGGIVQDVIVTELLPSSPSNLLLNAKLDPELVDGSGRPFIWSWDPKWNSETTGIVQLTTAVGPDGSTEIPVLRCARSSAGSGGDGPEAVMDFYVTGQSGATRQRPIPTPGAEFPASVTGRFWVKTVGMANVLVQIGSVQHVLYYSDASGTGLNVSHNDYYGPLAPNTGSQPWTLVEYTTPIHDNDLAVVAHLYSGMHDQGATGEVLIAGGDWAPTLIAA